MSQCAAHTRQGKECGQPAMQGATVCRLHGGKAPQTLAAAKRRLEHQGAIQWAEQQLAEHGLPDRTPLEHLEQVLEEDARAFAIWAAACAVLGSEGDSLLTSDRHGQSQIHPYVTERNQAAQRWARTSKYALDAGVSQRRVEIEQERAHLIATACRATLAALGLSQELQQKGLSILGQQLRQLGPGDVSSA